MRAAKWRYVLPLRLRSVFLRKRVEEELEEELLYHLEQRTQANIANGLAAEEAREEARRAMHGIEQRKEECRDARRVNVLDDLGRDLSYATRILRKSPAFTAVAVLSLALGIGANTAIFGLINALLLRPLPVPEPGRLSSIFLQARQPQFYLTYPIFRALGRQSHVFSHLCAWADREFQMRSGSDMVHINGVLASGDYFNTLGAPPALGRTFTPEDDQPSGGHDGPVAIISDRFWSERFQRSPAAIGRGLMLDGVQFTVIGVMPPNFFGAEVATRPDVWVPLTLGTQLGRGSCLNSQTCWWLLFLGRLKANVSERQAQVSMNISSGRILQESLPAGMQVPQQNGVLERRLVLAPGAQGWTPLRLQFSNPLAILMILVALVLLIACANIASLLSARASTRGREIAVRMAIGAGRARVVRQLLTESIVLSFLGASAGIACAYWLTKLMALFLESQQSGPSLPVELDLHPDWRVAVFTCALAISCGVLFGIAPALRASKSGIARGLKESAHQLRASHSLLGGSLVLSIQSALSVLLVAAAGLFTGTLFHLFTLNPGFDSSKVVLISIDTDRLPVHTIALGNLYSRLLDRANVLPGVVTASLMSVTPLSDGGWDAYLAIPGRSDLSEGQRDTFMNFIAPHFFDVTRIPLLAGRQFTPFDMAKSEKVGIINKLAATRFFPDKNPVGAYLNVPEYGSVRIVGIAANIKYLNLRDPDPPEMYLPYTQSSWTGSYTVAIKTNTAPQSISRSFRSALHELAPDVPIATIETMREHLDSSISRERLMASLSIFFGLLALLLTSIGLYGTLSYAVVSRTGEIGLRMALGAQASKVVWLVLHDTAGYVGLGVAVGTVAVTGLSPLVRTLLYGIEPNDPENMILAILALLLVALVASYTPAHRAATLDPTIALREE